MASIQFEDVFAAVGWIADEAPPRESIN